MAEEFQVSRANRAAVDTPPTPAPRPLIPDDPEAARAEIEATRARMSETIDEIEDVLMRKTEEIRDKFDVMAPVRERPLQTLGMIFGAGLALGLLTGGGGGDDDDEDENGEMESGEVDLEDDDDEAAEAWARAEAWEDRAHRLLRVARAQEAELEIHRSRRASLFGRRPSRHEIEEEDDDFEDEAGGDGFFDRIREGSAERISSMISEVMQRIMRGG